MTLKSMTGFARAEGIHAGQHWAWELKSVNGRGLDLRFRMPQGFDAVEAEARAAAGTGLVRGNCTFNLSVSRASEAVTELRINETAVSAILAALDRLPAGSRLGPASWDGILGLRGIVEVVEPEPDAAAAAGLRDDVMAGFAEALAALISIREAEGGRIGEVVAGQLGRIEALALEADASPARSPERIRDKLARSLQDLTSAAPQIDPDRLHLEAVLLAAKADIREEIDRLHAHVAAARELLESNGAVGRRLDFLAQEFNREANTLCAKAGDVEVTRIGLDLKAAVEQFREQVQNIE
jgi:uncharacterized protein (TIGR00255 family)